MFPPLHTTTHLRKTTPMCLCIFHHHLKHYFNPSFWFCRSVYRWSFPIKKHSPSTAIFKSRKTFHRTTIIEWQKSIHRAPTLIKHIRVNGPCELLINFCFAYSKNGFITVIRSREKCLENTINNFQNKIAQFIAWKTNFSIKSKNAHGRPSNARWSSTSKKCSH